MASGLDANTKLLTHFDGNDGSAAIIDSGYRSAMGGTQPGGNVGTMYATAAISSAQSKFGGASMFFDGNSDYLTFPDSNDWCFESSPFTIDCWCRFSVNNASQYIAGQYDPGGSVTLWYFTYHSSGKFYYQSYVGGTTLAFHSPDWTPTVDTWYHIALVRIDNADSADSWKVFINGTSLGTMVKDDGNWNAAHPNVASTYQISYNGDGSGGWFNGYMDEYRVSKGIARWSSDFTAPTAPYTADGKTNLLLHFDAADTPFTGATAKVGTYVGTAQHKCNDAAVAMIGNGSLALDGNSDYISIPDSADWVFGQNNFTIEGWFNFSSVAAGMSLYQQQTNDDSDVVQFFWSQTNAKLYFQVYTTGGGQLVTIEKAWTPSTGQWYHIALVRSGTSTNETKIYIDGVDQAATMSGGAWNYTCPDIANIVVIGADVFSSTRWYFNGYIDEYRVSNSARYTANFIPQITQFTSDANTLLLCHFDSYQIDSSTGGVNSPHVLTQVGTAYNTGDYVIGATAPAVGSGAWRFDGSDDAVTYADSDDWDFGSGDFTIDCWVKFNNNASNQYIFEQQSGEATNEIIFGYNTTAGNALRFYSYTGTADVHLSCEFTPIINTWYHLALVRNGSETGDTKIYINGVSQSLSLDDGSYNYTIPNIANVINIGRRGLSSPTNHFNGYIDELRISKGIARWTSNFTPPTSEYTADSNTKLLLHFDYDASDSSASAHAPTYVSNTYGCTALARFTGSLLLDGNSDYVTFPDSADWDFGTGNFTIDGWIRFNTTSGYQNFVSKGFGAVGNRTFITQWSTADGGMQMIYYDTSDNEYIVTFTWAPIANVWYHVAFVRNGADLKCFIDGTQIGTTHNISTLTLKNTNNLLYIGAEQDTTGSGVSYQFFNGYMDEIRVSKGIARWTSNFTPPTEPYGIASTTTRFPFVCNLLQ